MNWTRLHELREKRPLIHCVANQVSANDCANLVLAVGASPMMAAAPEEMAEITAISDATVLNTGTPSREKFQACRLCGEAAGTQPVVLDPVGVGASSWRLQNIRALLEHFTPSLLRVNLGEAKALLHRPGEEQGVDSPGCAALDECLTAAKALALQEQTTVLLSGSTDIVTDGRRVWRIDGGSAQMARITGSGCMLSALCGSFAAVAEDAAEAALLASAFWKCCGQRAEAEAGSHCGSFRAALLDAAGTLTAAELAEETHIIPLF